MRRHFERLTPMTGEVQDEMGRIALHHAALDGTADEVRGLLAAAADVSATDKQGFTALHFACQQNRAEVAEILLKAGAPVDARDRWGNTPLWRAVFNANGDPRIVRLLVRAGADPDIENASGRTPRQLAITIANYDTSEYFEDVCADTGRVPGSDAISSSAHADDSALP